MIRALFDTNVQGIVTRNLSDFRNSPIEACSPETFLERMKNERGVKGFESRDRPG